MRRCAWLLGILFATTVSAADKESVVEIDGLKSKPPAGWKEETPSNKMRYAQFKLGDAEMIIFKGLGGSAKDNINRWKGQFDPPKGKTIDDVAKVEEFKFGDRKATALDVTGTYKFKAAPFDPNAKEERKEDYRMIAIFIEGKNDPYQIKLTGPAKTVGEQKKAFDEWVKAFK